MQDRGHALQRLPPGQPVRRGEEVARGAVGQGLAGDELLNEQAEEGGCVGDVRGKCVLRRWCQDLRGRGFGV
jgi:hypothetical protein